MMMQSPVPGDKLSPTDMGKSVKAFEQARTGLARVSEGLQSQEKAGLPIGDVLALGDRAKEMGEGSLDQARENVARFDEELKRGEGGDRNERTGPYSHLEDPPGVEAEKDFTPSQKSNIIAENMCMNNGIVRSDYSGQELVPPQKSQRGVTPAPNEWQIDHITPKDKGGTNSYSNAQVLSRQENREKWNR